VKLLIKHGADVNQANEHGATAGHYATNAGQLEVDRGGEGEKVAHYL
jgi:hypothetical protein